MPSFPATVATDAELLVAIDNAQTVLAAGITSGDTSLSVVSAAAIASDVVVTIDSEMIKLGTVVGAAASGCTRGYGGTAAAAHLIGAAVNVNVIAAHHNVTAGEVKAIETGLGAGMAFVKKSYRTTAFHFALAPAGALTATLLATVTLSPFPSGITAASPNKHYLFITDAVAGNEVVLVTGRTLTTVSFTPALSHAAGQWTISSATAGIQEAVYAAGEGGWVDIPAGSHITYQQVFIPGAMSVTGGGINTTTIIPVATAANVFTCTWVSGEGRLTFMDFRVHANPPMSAGAIIYAEKYTDGVIRNIWMSQAYTGIDWNANDSSGGNPTIMDNIFMTNTVAIGIRHRSSGTGQTAGIISNFTGDGINAILLQLSGLGAGYTISNLWLQKCSIGIDIIAPSGRPVNESTISNFIIDQDAAAVAAITAIRITGTAGIASNGLTFVNGFIQCGVFGLIITNANNISVKSTRFNLRGANAMVVVDNSSKLLFSENEYTVINPAVTRCFQLQNIVADLHISGGKSHHESGISLGEFVNAGASVTDVTVSNVRQRGFTSMVVEAVPGTVEMHSNSSGLGPPSVGSAATITLPAVDDDGLVIISGTTNISRMLGGYANRKVRLQMQGALTFTTGGAGPGNAVVAFGPTTANQIVFASFNVTDGYWRYK